MKHYGAMNNQRITELLHMLNDADFVWLGTQRITYTSKDSDGNCEPDEIIHDVTGSIEIEELKYILRIFTLYNKE